MSYSFLMKENMGDRIKSERKRLDLTPDKLAELAGIPGEDPGSVIRKTESRGSDWNKYAPTIASVLGVTLEWLLTGKNPKHPPSEEDRRFMEQFNQLPERTKEAIRMIANPTLDKEQQSCVKESS